jgi:hypothetical protein
MSQSTRRSLGARMRSVVAALVSILALIAGVAATAPSAQAAEGDVTIFGTTVPAVASDSDTSGVELGVTFIPRVNGSVSAVRFYKGTANTGVHTGSVWNAAGSRLATVTFSDETASGWQVATFASPVSVTAGQRYIVSYYAPRGRYAAAGSFFSSAYTRGDLTVPANGGVYRYGASGYPTSTYNATNYYVDLVFRPSSSTPTTPPPSGTPTGFNPGNPNGTATVPTGMGLEDVSAPDHVIGNGTAASCTSAAVLSAVTAGGVITFNCGSAAKTITLSQTAKVRNSTRKLVLDGGGKVTLSGGNANRILYVDTCDSSLGTVSGNCLYAPQWPQVTVQNITLADGNATNAGYVSPGDTNGGSNGGGAIFALGGRLKVVKTAFVRNTCAANGPDLGGGAVRVLAQHSATPNSLDASQAARGQDPASIVQSTFGGASGQGNSCSNGGAISGLRTPITVLNSLLTYNNAIGCCSNPAKSGTPGGGSGGAVYTDGTSYDLKIAGSVIERNTAKAGGSSIFYVSNDRTGHLSVTGSTSRYNTYVPSGQSTDQHFENYPGIFYLGSGAPVFTNSTIQ